MATLAERTHADSWRALQSTTLLFFFVLAIALLFVGDGALGVVFALLLAFVIMPRAGFPSEPSYERRADSVGF